MMSFRDMTFCNDTSCNFFTERCCAALTKERLEKAREWWGKDDPPISIFTERLECYKDEKNI